MLKDFNDELLPRKKYLDRIRPFYHECELIKVITGVRRCGKSSLMKTIAQELYKSGIEENQIIFISLAKRPYKSIKTPAKLEEAIDKLSEGTAKTKYLFIDEIQNVKGFEKTLDAYREEKDYSIFITGSNSYLLSGELTTYLTGRYLEFEIGTLSFDEYIEMKMFFGRNVGSDMDREFIEYIQEGGFPLSVKFQNHLERMEYVKGLIKEIFEKDIKRNKTVKNEELFEKIQTYIINNFASPTSITSLCEYLSKTRKEQVDKAIVYRYLKILENAKIICKCNRFDLKSKSSLNGEEKYYLTDLSFYFAANIDNRINYGPCLENIIYNYAKSYSYDISVGRIGKLEIDFILRNINGDYSYVQVARYIDNGNYDEDGNSITEEREYRPFSLLRDGYPRYLLSMDKMLQRRDGVKHCNIVDFLLSRQQFC